MLGIYFTLILILFIGLIIGVVFAYNGDLKDQVEKPLYKSIAMYNDSPDNKTATKEAALKEAWNTVQREVRCKKFG